MQQLTMDSLLLSKKVKRTSMRKCAKSSKSVPKCEKVLESVPELEKV
jgi:hypothetical protein